MKKTVLGLISLCVGLSACEGAAPAPPPRIERIVRETSPQRAETVFPLQPFKGQLIPGFDGASYEPYQSMTVERIQQALAARGLYHGPVHGRLDEATMQAIYSFQKMHFGLELSGVPTPRTRKMIEQGSHTDPEQ